MYFWPQFIEDGHPAGVAPGDGGSFLQYLHAGDIESGPVGDVFIGLHTAAQLLDA